MKVFLTNFLLLVALSLFAQQKGVTPVSGNSQSATGQTYAVVVGISDYQDEEIPDLRFADKDAEAFAAFLQSPAGGSLDEDHLKVLLNEKATVAQFAIQLDWLMEVTGENDRVIVYFSGHGDVERKTITQPGYLLCWDAPSKIYLAGGALALPMFQDVITTLSVQNKAKVVVITDACRSGKLSGSSVGGSQITGTNLAKQYANEIKILSCQPDEYSIEGEQWGGGRGAFSYHLLDGLSGMADGNADLNVNVKELGRYLEDRVAEEVAPQNQNPMIIGNKLEKLSDVFPKFLAKIKERKKGQMQLFTATESRGIEDDVLAAADSNVVEMYFAFKKALEDKQFLFAESGRAENDYADFYYEKLIKEVSLKRLHSTMRRNFAAALQDDAQQVMNGWIKYNEFKLPGSQERISEKLESQKLKSFPDCLDRAAELLGSRHYMYKKLKARKHFFEGFLLTNRTRLFSKQEGHQALSEFRKALALQPEMPQVYWQMSIAYGVKLRMIDSMEYYTLKAIDLYPSWEMPLERLIFFLSDDLKRLDLAEKYAEKALSRDSLSKGLLNSIGTFYFRNNNYPKAIDAYNRVIQKDSFYHTAYGNLGNIYLEKKQYKKTEFYYKKTIEIDSTFLPGYYLLNYLYQYRTGQYDKAEKHLKEAIGIDSTYSLAYKELGNLYVNSKRYKEAEIYLKKAIKTDSSQITVYKDLGYLYTRTEQFKEAEKYLKKAISADSNYIYAYRDLGILYGKLERYDEAEYSLKRALKLNPNLSDIHSDLAKLYSKTGRKEKAVKSLTRILDVNPGDYFALLGLVNLLYEDEKQEAAEEYIQSFIQKNPDISADAYIRLACLKSLRNQPDEAFEYLEKSIEKSYRNYDFLQNDEDLIILRNQKKKWEQLMNKHFPNQ